MYNTHHIYNVYYKLLTNTIINTTLFTVQDGDNMNIYTDEESNDVSFVKTKRVIKKPISTDSEQEDGQEPNTKRTRRRPKRFDDMILITSASDSD